MTRKQIQSLLGPILVIIAIVAGAGLLGRCKILPDDDTPRLAPVSHGKVRDVPDDFNWKVYVANYPDLGAAGIDTEAEAIEHWRNWGKNEGRDYHKALTPQAQAVAAASDDRKDLSVLAIAAKELDRKEAPVPLAKANPLLPPDFNWETYINNYGDLQFINTEEQAIDHWLKIGSKEGRSYKKIPYQPAGVRSDFDWQTYLNNYPELRAAGINTKEKAIAHWLKQGKREGRTHLKVIQ